MSLPEASGAPRRESRARSIGLEIMNDARRRYAHRVRRAFDPAERIIRLASRDQTTQWRVLQLTGALPMAQEDPRRLLAEVGEYLDDPRVSAFFRLPARAAVRLGRAGGALGAVSTRAASAAVLGLVEGVLARRFFAGRTLEEALGAIRRLRRAGFGVTVDVLGERALSREDVERHAGEYRRLLASGAVDDISVKLSGFDPEFDPAARARTAAAVRAALAPLLDAAVSHGASVTIDMEQYLYKDLTVEFFCGTLRERSGTPPLGLALQAYVREETEADLEAVARCAAAAGALAGVRLVKGANWDLDVALAMKKGWPVPLYTRKEQTDAAFERLAARLLERSDALRPAFGTHNIRSIASVIAHAESLGLPARAYEFQFLYGMVPMELAHALLDRGHRVRFYTPYGDLLPGMAYLVRRFLENASNVSFLKHFSYRRRDVERELEPPAPGPVPAPAVPATAVTPPVAWWAEPALRALRELAAVCLSWTVPGVARAELAAAAEVFTGQAAELEALARASVLAVRSMPGESNEYFYSPRGPGALIVEDPGISVRGFAEYLAAPLAAGCRVDAFVPGRFKRMFVPLAVKVGLEDRVRFHEGSDMDNEAEARRSDHAWVVYAGPSAERAGRLAALVLNAGEPFRPSGTPRFVTRMTPGALSEFLVPRSFTENTLRGGFAPDLALGGRGGLPGFESFPEARLHRADVAAQLESARARSRTEYPPDREYPARVGPDVRRGGAPRPSVNPADPGDVLGQVFFASAADTADAVAEARAAFPSWAARPAAERAAILRRAARAAAASRFSLAMLIRRECAKNPDEALREVDETVDFLNYYARSAELLEAGERPGGWGREPYGVVAVISPWNFPLAIPCGMTAAALAVGNAVVLKPAEQTPVVASELVRFLREAGVPPAALHYLPGTGGETGRTLAAHPDVGLIAFTGSLETGRTLAGTGKPMVCEMGGKNAIIVDEDADLDEAVAGVIVSAFGYSGQKCSACSRVIVVGGALPVFERKLKAKFGSMVIGPPDDAACRVGPLIDPAAKAKVERYRRLAAGERGVRVLAERHFAGVPGADPRAAYADPVILEGVGPHSSLAQEEIFGPVLCVFHAKDLDEALRLANSTVFALTGGVYTQAPSHIEKAKRLFEAGNLYVNRPITGAAVDRQPFGGYRHSGGGTKAGGPDYAANFLRWTRSPGLL